MFAVLNIFAIMIPLSSTESLRALLPLCPDKKHNSDLMQKMLPTVIYPGLSPGKSCLSLSPGSMGPADDEGVSVKIM